MNEKKKKEKIIFRIKLILLQFRKYDKITTDRFIHNFLIKIHILFLRAMKKKKKKKKKLSNFIAYIFVGIIFHL